MAKTKLKFVRDTKIREVGKGEKGFRAGQVVEMEADRAQRWLLRGAAIDLDQKAAADKAAAEQAKADADSKKERDAAKPKKKSTKKKAAAPEG